MVIDESTPVRNEIRNRHRDRALAVAGTVVAAVLVWLVSGPLLGADLRVEVPDQEAFEIGLAPTLLFSLVPALLGWALLAVLERFTAKARVIWTVIAVAVLALSFVPLVNVPAAGDKVALAVLHLVVGAVLIPVFWRTSR